MFILSFDKFLYESNNARELYDLNPKLCNYCNKKISFEKRRYDSCSHECSTLYRNKINRDEYEDDPKYCLNCGKKISYKDRDNTFCNSSCSATVRNTGRPRTEEEKEKVRTKLKIVEYRVCELCKGKYLRKFFKQRFCGSECAEKNNINIAHMKHLLKKKDNPNYWSEIIAYSWTKEDRELAGGRTKYIPYKRIDNIEIKVQGTYEERTCKILDYWKSTGTISDWVYSIKRFPYIDSEGKKRTYRVDFKIIPIEEKEYYLEVKGFAVENDYTKWKAVRDTGTKIDIWFLRDIKIEEELIKIQKQDISNQKQETDKLTNNEIIEEFGNNVKLVKDKNHD